MIILKLEDDVISSNGFISTISAFIEEQKSDWLMTEFCNLGFIGKLWKTKDLTNLINYFMMFSFYMPVDTLHLFLERNFICSNLDDEVKLN